MTEPSCESSAFVGLYKLYNSLLACCDQMSTVSVAARLSSKSESTSSSAFLYFQFSVVFKFSRLAPLLSRSCGMCLEH